MPRGDRSGPMGMGPRTGRGMGYCSGHEQPGFANPGPGFGWGRGWRHRAWGRGPMGWFGFGAGPVWGAPPTPEEEVSFLKAQAEQLRVQLESLTSRIADLEGSEPE